MVVFVLVPSFLSEYQLAFGIIDAKSTASM